MGAPLLEGLPLVQNTLVGAGLRDEMRVGASGKLVTAAMICEAMGLGADWVNSARAFMFSVGCIQAQRCHTNRCPVGVTTQDPKLQRALVVSDKAERVHNFHRNTVHAVAEMIAAAGVDHPSEIGPDKMYRRISHTEVLPPGRDLSADQPRAVRGGHRPRAVPALLGPGVRRPVPARGRSRAARVACLTR